MLLVTTLQIMCHWHDIVRGYKRGRRLHCMTLTTWIFLSHDVIRFHDIPAWLSERTFLPVKKAKTA